MTTGRDSTETKQAKAYASAKLVRVHRSIANTSEQYVANSKWLTASLLAINGAGAIALLNGGHSPRDMIAAGLLFVGGLVFALLGAAAIQDIAGRVMPRLYAAEDYWNGVSVDGCRDEQREAELTANVDKAYRWSWLPPLLGWLSGLAFIAGCTAAVLRLA